MTASRASPVVAEQHTSPVLGLAEETADFLVDDLLGALGVGSFLAEHGSGRWESCSDP